VRQLLPEPVDLIDPTDAVWNEQRPAADRPWVLTNMVESLDGAATVDGRSGGLGGPADRAVFGALRSVADVVLVGAGTVRAERYGPIRLNAQQSAARSAAGRTEAQRIAVVTSSLRIDADLPLFCEGPRPLIITSEQGASRASAELADVADIVPTGSDTVNLATAISELGARGAACVLCEGGPTLLGQLLSDDLVDEWDVTVAPLAAGGTSRRIVVGEHDEPTELELVRVWESDGALFLRHIRPNHA
jgi:riboflavin biosynthesis pyrimidine reductase